MTMKLTSPAFENGKPIPVKYTGDGEDISPPLQWTNLPAGTAELAMIVDDPDAPRPQPWVHWVIYKIPADSAGLSENVPHSLNLNTPAGALQGMNTSGQIGYQGPAPPRGHGRHRYFFKLYAIKQSTDLKGGFTKDQLLKAISDRIAGQAELMGTYQR